MSHSPFVKSSDLALHAELQLILNAVVEGVCGLDGEGNATFCNDALLTMTGYRAEELVGRNVHTLLHHSRPDGTPYPADECAFRKGIEAGQATHIVGEFLWRKNGTCFPTEYWMRVLSQPSSGTCYLVTVKDVTDIQQARDVLRRSEERFRRILASAPDIAWTAERSGRTIYVSPKVEAVLGYTKQEICSGGTQLWLGRIHPEDFGPGSMRLMLLFLRSRLSLTKNTASAGRTESGSGSRTARPVLTKKTERFAPTAFSPISRGVNRLRRPYTPKPHFWKHKPIPPSMGIWWSTAAAKS
jgi:PAS domain S-box-containing protein